jgi:hypothetical protein
MRRSGGWALVPSVPPSLLPFVLTACAALVCNACGAGRGDGASTVERAVEEDASGAAEPGAGDAAAGERSPAGAATGEAVEVEPAPIPRNTAVLHVGDSFVLAGFSQALKPRLKELGVRYEVRSEQSSYTVTWASKIELLVQNTQPDLVIITLGANEVSNTAPRSHAPAVRRIVKLVGARPCVWVTPPSWRKDTGIIDVIRQNAAPCRVFDSDQLVGTPIPRQPDKIHPTREGGEIWATAFWSWLQAERLPAGAAKSPWALRPASPEEYQPPAGDRHVAQDKPAD